MLFRYIDKSKEVETIKQERTEMELKFLKSQINPHILFNNLNTIYSYSLEKPDETPDLILKLSDNLKHVLYESNAEKVPLSKELHFIDNYIEFHKIRTEGIKEISYTKNVKEVHHKIAPLLLITIIENAFKHSSVNSIIDLSLDVENSQLLFICKNDYLEQNSTNNNTIGLTNLRKRLELLYENKHELVIDKSSNFNVTIKLTLI
ncbi:sensor histidine kinase [Tenacibaculum sp. nBUS_03]|uniref:sensor histidine kinase n=1 Tax=Tenacibaculum sp. nBUS_03 TaxID=3395320 RepID=UPI003EB8CB7F